MWCPELREEDWKAVWVFWHAFAALYSWDLCRCVLNGPRSPRTVTVGHVPLSQGSSADSFI